MVVESTRFVQKEIHKQTSLSSEATTLNQISHVWIEPHGLSVLMNIKRYWKMQQSEETESYADAYSAQTKLENWLPPVIVYYSDISATLLRLIST